MSGLSESGVKDDKSQKLEELYNKYCRLMKYIALKLLNNDTLADDAVHNAFIKLMKYFDKIKEIDCHKTRTLVAVVTESECKDLIKNEKRQKHREARAFNSGLTFKESAVDVNLIETAELNESLNKLPEKYRTVLMLKTYYNLSDKEIAEVLNVSRDNVRKRMQRARALVLDILKEKEM